MLGCGIEVRRASHATHGRLTMGRSGQPIIAFSTPTRFHVATPLPGTHLQDPRLTRCRRSRIPEDPWG